MSNMHRIQWFDQQIRAGNYPNSNQLAERYEISRRQAQRDIEYLEISLHAPLLYVAKQRGYCYTDKDYYVFQRTVVQDKNSTQLVDHSSPSKGNTVNNSSTAFMRDVKMEGYELKECAAMKWSGQRVLITGSGSGIGRALAVAYAKHGAELILVDRSHEGLLETKRCMENSKDRAGIEASVQLTVCDLSKPDEIEQLFRHLREQGRAVHVLINNAGFGIWKSPYELELSEWDAVMNTNLRGTFLCAREAAKIMREHGGGAIVNIASTRAHMSEPNSEAYAASKGGIASLTHALALSFGPDNITVNTISPGWIETGDYEQLRAEDHLQHPAQRVGKPEDIVKACFYLTDPSNDFVTGIDLVVDGGMTRKMMYIE